METKKGICDHSEGEGDGSHNNETILYKMKGRWLCGDCASEWEGDAKFYNSEYPQD